MTYLPVCSITWSGRRHLPMFQRSFLPPSSQKDGGSKHLWNISKFLPDYISAKTQDRYFDVLYFHLFLTLLTWIYGMHLPLTMKRRHMNVAARSCCHALELPCNGAAATWQWSSSSLLMLEGFTVTLQNPSCNWGQNKRHETPQCYYICMHTDSISHPFYKKLCNLKKDVHLSPENKPQMHNIWRQNKRSLCIFKVF